MTEHGPHESSKEARFAIAAFLIAVVLLGVGLELFGRFGVARASRVEARIQNAMTVAKKTLTAPSREGVSRILVLGNSIANDGVDLSLLERELAPRATVVSGIVEDTAWLDWRYFLSRVHGEGWRPEIVLFVCRPMHFAMPNTRGRYGASRLYGFADIPEIASRTGRDATRTSELMFASLSSFYGFRAELTKIALTTGIPGFVELASQLRAPTPPPATDAVFLDHSKASLAELRTITAEMGARIVIAIPPARANAGIGVAPFDEAARMTDVRVIRPIDDEAWPPEQFADGFHLNAIGRQAFTSTLAASLRALGSID